MHCVQVADEAAAVAVLNVPPKQREQLEAEMRPMPVPNVPTGQPTHVAALFAEVAVL